MKSIRKAVIPAAGFGTRFLPATKAQPKEMLPIVDTPAIQYIVKEALDSGIEEILIITGRSKRAIEDHFDSSVELEELLQKQGKNKQLAMVKAWMLNNHLIARVNFNVFTFNTVIRCMLKCHRMLRCNHTFFDGTGLTIIG